MEKQIKDDMLKTGKKRGIIMKRNFLSIFGIEPYKIRDYMLNEILIGIQENGGEIINTQIQKSYPNHYAFFLVLYEDNNHYSEIHAFLESYEEITKKTIWHSN